MIEAVKQYQFSERLMDRNTVLFAFGLSLLTGHSRRVVSAVAFFANTASDRFISIDE